VGRDPGMSARPSSGAVPGTSGTAPWRTSGGRRGRATPRGGLWRAREAARPVGRPPASRRRGRRRGPPAPGARRPRRAREEPRRIPRHQPDRRGAHDVPGAAAPDAGRDPEAVIGGAAWPTSADLGGRVALRVGGDLGRGRGEEVDAGDVGQPDQIDEDVGQLLGQRRPPVGRRQEGGDLVVAPPLTCSSTSPTSTASRAARFFGVWNRSQSRSAAKRRSAAARSSRAPAEPYRLSSGRAQNSRSSVETERERILDLPARRRLGPAPPSTDRPRRNQMIVTCCSSSEMLTST